MDTRTVAECHQAQRMRESAFAGQVHRIRAEGASAARALLRAAVAVGLRFCLLVAEGSKSQWARVRRNFPKEDTTAASHQRVAEAPLQAVLVVVLPAATAVQKRRTKVCREVRRRAQPTRVQKQWSRMRKQAGKCTHCLFFCNLYICHRVSGYNHCNGFYVCGNNDMLLKSSGAALPVAVGHLDRAHSREGRHRKEVRKAVGIHHSCKAQAEDAVGRIHHASNSRVAQPRSVADPAAPEQEADCTYCQAERDNRLAHR